MEFICECRLYGAKPKERNRLNSFFLIIYYTYLPDKINRIFPIFEILLKFYHISMETKITFVHKKISSFLLPSLLQEIFFFQILEERFTAFFYISIGRFKISCIPWICYIPWVLGIVKQPLHLMIRISADNSQDVANIPLFHSQYIIIFLIVCLRNLNCPFSLAGNPMFRQLLLCRRIHRIPNTIPDFFGTGGCRSNIELICNSLFDDHIF